MEIDEKTRKTEDQEKYRGVWGGNETSRRVVSFSAPGSNDLKICAIFYGVRGITENS